MIERIRLVEAQARKADEQATKKVRGRPFQPGNPGRPPGAKNRLTQMIEQLLAEKTQPLTQKLIEIGLDGDARTIRYCLDRVSPRRYGRPVDFKLPPINDVRDVVAAMAAITTGVNDGNLTPEEADHLVHVLEVYTKAFETHDLAARLENLESRVKKTS